MSACSHRCRAGLAALVALSLGCAGEAPSSPPGDRASGGPDTGGEARVLETTRITDGVLVLGMPAVDPAGLERDLRDRLDASRKAAAIAEDIHWTLGDRGRIAVRDTLEQILAHPGDAPPAIVERIREFAERVFVWHGTVDPRTGRGLRPRFIPGELAAAAEAAAGAGARLPLPDVPDPGATRTERLEALMVLIRPLIFPPSGGAEGAPDTPDGGADDEPAEAIGPLAARLRAVLEGAGVRTAEPGPDARPEQLIPGGLGPGLAVILGYRGRGEVTGFGALVALPDPGEAAIVAAVRAREADLRRLATETGDGKVPAGRYTPRALVPVAVADATGAYGPVLEPGLFPVLDGPLVADPGGGRVLLATNLARALDGAAPIRAQVAASSPDPETARRRLEHRACSRVLRHALAAAAWAGTDGTERRPREFLVNRLGPAAPVMEELRSLAAVLHLSGAPGVTSGLPGGEACARTVLDDFAASAAEHLLDTPEGREGPAAVARRIALGWLAERGGLGGVEREGRALLAVVDEGKLRAAAADLLGEVRRIRYRGDGDAARILVERHGRIPASWSAAAASLVAAGGGLRTVAFAFPAPGAREAPAGIAAARVERARRRAQGQDVF